MTKFESYLNRRIDGEVPFKKLLEFPKYIEIETGNACNARCPMCTINDWERNFPTMKDDVFYKIADDLINNSHHLKRVSLYRDGEPLLDKKLPSRISYLKSNGVNNISIATNVSLLNEKNSEKLLSSGLDLIIMSIDSLDKEITSTTEDINTITEDVQYTGSDNEGTFFEINAGMVGPRVLFCCIVSSKRITTPI